MSRRTFGLFPGLFLAFSLLWALSRHMEILQHNAELDAAVIRGDLVTLRSLVAKGEGAGNDPSWRSRALLQSIKFGHNRVALWLLDYGASAAARDDEPALIHSVRGGSVEIAQALLHRGATWDVQASHGTPALSLAVCRRDVRMIRLLLAAGSGIETRDTNGLTPLFYAAQVGEPVVSFLLSRGARVNARDNGGRSPLFLAAADNNSAAVKVLLAAGADVRLRDQYGWTPLSLAENGRCMAAVQLIKRAGRNRSANKLSQR